MKTCAKKRFPALFWWIAITLLLIASIQPDSRGFANFAFPFILIYLERCSASSLLSLHVHLDLVGGGLVAHWPKYSRSLSLRFVID